MQDKRLFAALCIFLLIALCLAGTACGGGSGSTFASNSTGQPGGGSTGGANATAATITFADSPSDRVVGFELTVTSITLTRADGSVLTLLSIPRRIEVTHVSGSAEPLVLPTIPQGTYTSATVVVSAPDVAFIDNSGHEVEKKDAALTKTITIPLSPALVVGGTPVVLTLDVDARASLTIDTATGNVTVNPTASFLMSNVAQSENEQEVENGEFEHIVGKVTSSSANSFTITTSAGATMTFATSSGTSFEGATNAAGLTANTLVRVEGRTQADGSLLAKEVEVVSNAGTEGEGLITATTGNPVTSFTMVVQDGNGSGMDANSLGNTVTVNITNRTKFRIDNGKLDLSGLNLPNFSAASLSKGQRVEAESDNAMANGAIAAESIKLQEQALVGAVSAVNGSQFTLTLPDDAAFKLLTGKNTLTVVMQANTKLKNGATVTAGAVVKVRGLVFLDPAQGTFTMVAGRITTP